ncbi:hypothetical protein BD309DRAFT_182545 [Dichomitus squalens]|uniref:Uncharacterized protein n=1 Tax=Dichomitus squalens TaxID=114155 RepID=A0A4Q9MQQ8_9APHY|nr:uncharacterized protein DICSQDRAFT_101718 [Dichomitus squalens LYAD-421 SS1]EJF63737.1 hypothetical protein DICSQDRAFT_101718 [Dichomitus squalens LYAD-421 SS1]TBU28496.1 hypothetical protein BD311DRAFT_323990 [Dichomitus squalens]TBU48926.1 hypothetical protein BD309DRAFT_182545 [Dichomitus squalens]
MTISTADTVTATLHYFAPPLDGSKPYHFINADPITGKRAKNWETVTQEREIENIRGKEHTVSLDTTGFQFYRRAVPHTTFENDEVIEKEYYPQSIELAKELTGASRVVVFDHTIRRRRPDEIADTPQKRQPVPLVHIDQTAESAVARVHRHLPAEDVPKLLANRFQIINLWRPIHHAAWDWPLALCDYRTVDRSNDLVPTTLKYPDRDGETFSVKFNPANKWRYLRGMEPDEIVLIKCYDSQDDGKTAIFTPHTAFEDPTTPKDAPLRESIELRLLVFYD